MKRLYYCHDPMCSWCWAFRPALCALRAQLPTDIAFIPCLGGLAADSDEPMSNAMREYLKNTWRRIQRSVPGTEFNFDFWHRCTPRRSTWPACRAVIAAGHFDLGEEMTARIQRAYYLEARDPSDETTLIALAAELDIPCEAFTARLEHAETHAELARQIAHCGELGVEGLPSLVLDLDGSRWPIPVDYRDADKIRETIEQLIAFSD